MISKVPPKRKDSKSSFKTLKDYICDSEKSDFTKEKNLLSIETADIEMKAMAAQSTRVKDPVYHFVLSWQENEKPTKEQSIEAANIALEKIGMSEHQAIIVGHNNTDNYHIHVEVNRVHPDTGRAVYPMKDYLKLNQACKEIEIKQGWERSKELDEKEEVKKIQIDRTEKDAIKEEINNSKSWSELHQNLEKKGLSFERKGGGAVIKQGDSELCKASDLSRQYGFKQLQQRFGNFEPSLKIIQSEKKEKVPPEKENTPLSEGAKQVEIRSGQESLERFVKEHATDKIKNAKSWDELHQSLSEIGLNYELKGSGAVIKRNDETCKASAAGRTAGLGRLEKRLGEYQPPVAKKQEQKQKPEPKQTEKPQEPEPRKPSWKQYQEDKAKYYQEKKQRWSEQRAREKEYREKLKQQQKADRDRLYQENWKGRGDLLNTWRSVMAAKHASERADLKDRIEKEREPLSEQYPRYNDYKTWCQNNDQAISFPSSRKPRQQIGTYDGDKDVKKVQDIRSYTHEIHGREVHYKKENTNSTDFVDRGKQIGVYNQGDQSIKSALQLGGAKWGRFEITGSEEFKKQVIEIAVREKLDWHIKNAELQEAIKAEQERQKTQQQEQKQEQEKKNTEPGKESEQEQSQERKPTSPGRGR
jgi:hypothetical protein